MTILHRNVWGRAFHKHDNSSGLCTDLQSYSVSSPTQEGDGTIESEVLGKVSADDVTSSPADSDLRHRAQARRAEATRALGATGSLRIFDAIPSVGYTQILM